MRRVPVWILSIVLGAASVGLVGACGGDEEPGLIPRGTAEELLRQLDEVEALAGDGDCVSARDAAEEMRQRVDDLPRDTDEELRQVLEDGIDRLQSLTESFETCTGEERPVETVPTETVPTETETQETQTRPERTQTQQTQTQPTQTQPTQPQPVPQPPSGGGGVGPGAGGGAP